MRRGRRVSRHKNKFAVYVWRFRYGDVYTLSRSSKGGLIVRYENMIFDSQTLVLDDNQFIDCKFKNCVLTYSGGKFEVYPFLADGIEIKLEGPALNTSQMLHVVQIAKSRAIPAGGQVELGGQRFTKNADQAVPLS